jgi:hypothetical protein
MDTPVEEDEVDGVLVEEAEDGIGIGEHGGLVAVIGEAKGKHLGHEEVIVDDRDIRFHKDTSPLSVVPGSL